MLLLFSRLLKQNPSCKRLALDVGDVYNSPEYNSLVNGLKMLQKTLTDIWSLIIFSQ